MSEDIYPHETGAATGKTWEVKQETADARLRQISASQHSVHTRQLSGLRDLDGEDARVREGTAQALAPQHSWQRDICGVERTTSDFCRSLNVTCRLTDAD